LGRTKQLPIAKEIIVNRKKLENFIWKFSH